MEVSGALHVFWRIVETIRSFAVSGRPDFSTPARSATRL